MSRTGGDHLIFPLFAVWFVGGTWGALELGLSPVIVAAVVIGPAAVVAGILERVRPARREFVPLDQPLRIELSHFVFDYHLGYLLAVAGGTAIDQLAGTPAIWPTTWPVVAQIALALAIAEGISYWQHVAFHRVPWLWRFHALHHSGARLNLARAGRFHFMDIGLAALIAYVPLGLMHAPEPIMAWTSTLIGALGVLGHANIQMHTPAWLDRWVCTPGVHRLHHSRDLGESTSNYGTSVMIWDRVFGSYRQPVAGGPAAMGIDGDRLPTGFLGQMFGPFRRAR